MAIHLIVFQKFQCGPKWWTDTESKTWCMETFLVIEWVSEITYCLPRLHLLVQWQNKTFSAALPASGWRPCVEAIWSPELWRQRGQTGTEPRSDLSFGWHPLDKWSSWWSWSRHLSQSLSLGPHLTCSTQLHNQSQNALSKIIKTFHFNLQS